MKSKPAKTPIRMHYSSLLAAISQAHQQAQAGAAGAVNRHLVLRNWIIGAHIVEYEQNGKDRAKYGDRLLLRIATDLASRRISGLGVSMLKNARQFFRLYPQIRQPAVGELLAIRNILPIGPPVVDQLGRMPIPSPTVTKSFPTPLLLRDLMRFSWTHFIELIRIDDPWKRAFYENECLKGNWSKRQLQRQIESLLYERTGLSTDKKAVIRRGRMQATDAPAVIADLIRDPYVLEFTGLADRPCYHETDLEIALLDHLQSFLLELGAGFCFEARQKRITVGNEHDYLDLVFYHRLLRCHLLIDLKVRAFRHADVGQMNFYLNYWKKEIMAEGDNPPVGLLLCSDKDQTKVEYAAAGLDRKLFVSRYLVAFPKKEQLQHLIENDRVAWEQGRGERTK